MVHLMEECLSDTCCIKLMQTEIKMWKMLKKIFSERTLNFWWSSEFRETSTEDCISVQVVPLRFVWLWQHCSLGICSYWLNNSPTLLLRGFPASEGPGLPKTSKL
jgi:hypothetical protein